MRRKPLLLIIPLIILFLISSSFAESAPDYAATTMRLLRYDGAVQIYDVTGAPRFLLENVRFASGEAMETGEDGTASVSLDDSKIVSLDTRSFVEFIQESDHIRLNLKKGAIFLDVSEKLDENAGLDIQTSTMTVGIRGTIVQVVEEEDPEDPENLITQLGVMEGNTNVTYTDEEGSSRLINVSAGQKISVPRRKSGGGKGVNPVVSNLTASDIKPVTKKQITANPAILNRITNAIPEGENLLQGSVPESDEDYEELFPADGTWTYDGLVSLVAQSASKLYDGTPLTRPEALVSGLPAGLKIDLKIEGSITNAGKAKNTVTGWTVTNGSGENVTAHITNVKTTEGDLVVDQAPIYIWTGSAEKVYDGEPLVCEEAEVHTVEGHVSTDPDWKNSSIVTRTALGSERMVSLSGSTLVHGTNPLTGETKEINLPAGKALTVALSSDPNDKEGSIKYVIEDLTEDNLPEEAVRLYADNPDLLAAACAETGWDPEKILARAKSSNAARTKQNGLNVTGADSSNIVINSTNVRIQVDSDFISYDSRALGSGEAKFSPIRVDKDIIVTATGSQTEIGESRNTCSIDWNGVNPNNYKVRQDLGTLTVLPPDDKPIINVTSGSAHKAYDGTPLEASCLTAVGLPEGYEARAIYAGAQTDVGSSPNIMTSVTILDENDNPVTDQFRVVYASGTLTVTPAALTVTTGSAEKPYDGEPLTCDVFSVSGLAAGDDITVTPAGTQTDAGSVANTYTLSWGNAKSSNYTLSDSLGTLTVNPAVLTVTTGSDEKPYDGTPLTCSEASLSGLASCDDAEVTATGSQTEVGSSENTYTITWNNTKPANYTVSENLGTLEVTQNDDFSAAITVTAASMTAEYNGEELSNGDYTVTGLPDDYTLLAEISGGQTDAGSSANEIVSYTITQGDKDYTSNFTNVTLVNGTLTVTPYVLSFDCGCDGIDYTFGDTDILAPTVTCNGMTQTAELLGDGGAEAAFDLDTGDTIYLRMSNYPQDCMSSGEIDTSPYFTVDPGAETNYSASFSNKTITIKKLQVSVSKESEIRVYDGYPGPVTTDMIKTGDRLDLVEYSLDNTEELGPDAGTYQYEAYTFVDYEYMDDIEIDKSGMGTLTIQKAPLGISSQEQSKDYDGSPLTLEDSDVQITGLVNGETLDFTLSNNSVTDGGTAVQPEITLDWGDTNKDNYEVSTSLGALYVNKVPLEIKSTAKSKGYDGTPLTLSETEISITGLVNEETISLTLSNNSVTKGGASVQPKVTIDWGTTNKDNYNVTMDIGELSVTKAPLTITTGSKESYDSPVTCDEYTISGTVYEGDSITVNVTGSLSVVGDCNNTFEIDYAHSVNADCYEITSELGTLTLRDEPATYFVFVQLLPDKVYSDVDYYFSPTFGDIPFTGSTSNGGRDYVGTCTLNNGDVAQLTVTNLPLPTDTPGTYSPTKKCEIISYHDPEHQDEYVISYDPSTITVVSGAPPTDNP